VLTGGQVSATGNVTGGNVKTNNIYSVLVGDTLTINAQTISLNPTGNVGMNSRYITGLADPVQDQDAATKYYVDSVAQGLDPKASVVLGTTANLAPYTYNNGTSGVGATITLTSTGNLTLDGSIVTVNSRVLIKNEVGAYVNNTTQSAAFNGIYVVTTAGAPGVAAVLTRSADMNVWAEVPNAFTFVETGATLADTGWVSTANATGTMGTTQITWTQFSGAGSYTAGNALSLTGSQFNVLFDTSANATIGLNGSNQLYIPAGAVLTTPNIGAATGTSVSVTGTVTASTVNSTTVSASGNVTGGNVLTGGLISSTGNVTGGNVLTGGLISATSTITSATTITGGNLATGGTVSAGGNITGANILTGGLISATATITGGNLATGGTASVTGNITGGNVLTGGLVSVTGNITSGANIVAPANVIGGNITTGGLISATATITGGNVATGGTVSATGNITGGNLITSGAGGAISGSGNITGGNILTGGIVSATGNITGNYFIGNGSQLTGVPASFPITAGTSNIAAATNANILFTIGGTANVLTVASTGIYTAGLSSVTGTITGGNVLTGGVMSSTGNGTHGNVNTGGIVSATGNIITASGGLLGIGTSAPDADVNILAFPQTVSYTITGNSTTQGTDLHISGVDGSNTRITQDAFGTGSYVAFTGRSARGTAASPTQTQSGDIIAEFTGRGFSNASLQFGNASTGKLDVVAAENFTDTSRATNVVVYTTATGAITPTAVATFSSASGLSVTGAVTASGNANIAGGVFFVNSSTNTASFGNSTQTTNALVAFNSTTSILLPVGNTTQRPATGVTGMQRFNTATNSLEIFNNTAWQSVGATTFTVITDQQFNGDGSTVAFTLSSSQTTSSCIVSINGVVQIPTIAYSVSTTTLTFTEAPASGDVIDVRQLTTTTTVTAISNTGGNSIVSVSENQSQVNITGNLNPTSNIAYNLGNSTAVWNSITVAQLTATGNSSIAGTLTVNSNAGATAIINGAGNAVGNIGSTGTRFNTVFALATSAQYADLAEKYTADAEYAPGTVLVFGGAQEVTVNAVDGDRKVAGVISTNPSYIMNDGLEAEHVATVALTGRVPTMVVGPVRKGDMMVAAGLGRARSETEPQVGSVIGKALEDFDGAEGVIEVVVGRF